jgi:hypothetical protein
VGRMLRGISSVSVIVVLAAAMAFTGCSNNSPLAPDSDFMAKPGIILAGGDAQPIATVLVEKDISAEDGGLILINRDVYQHSFAIQPNAIPADARISVKSYKDKVNGIDAIVFEFGPDGLIFSQAANLDFQMSELDSRAVSAKLHYYDPNVKSWVLQSNRSVVNGHVGFDIYHFSKYAISD